MQRRTISLGLVAVAALPLWGCAAAGIANGPGGAAHGKTARQWSDTLAGIETAALGDDMFESTIQAGHGPGQEAADLLDDEEIERSIREINEAIRRTAQKRG